MATPKKRARPKTKKTVPFKKAPAKPPAKEPTLEELLAKTRQDIANLEGAIARGQEQINGWRAQVLQGQGYAQALQDQIDKKK